MITIIQRAKFFLMRERGLAIEIDPYNDRDRIVSQAVECGPIQPAVVEIDGLIRLNSDTPKDAAHAARINAAIDRLNQAIPPVIP